MTRITQRLRALLEDEPAPTPPTPLERANAAEQRGAWMEAGATYRAVLAATRVGLERVDAHLAQIAAGLAPAALVSSDGAS